MVKCPFCKAETKVIETRESDESVRRRRECLACEKRFTTYERPDVMVMIVKKDGRREAYERMKIAAGITKACEKRPISSEQIDAVVDRIENRLRTEDEVTSKQIGELVMKELKKIDQVAYIRFASVYREFDDIATFEKELKLLRR